MNVSLHFFQFSHTLSQTILFNLQKYTFLQSNRIASRLFISINNKRSPLKNQLELINKAKMPTIKCNIKVENVIADQSKMLRNDVPFDYIIREKKSGTGISSYQ